MWLSKFVHAKILKTRSRLSKDIAVEHKPHHSEVRKLFKTIYCMPKRFLSHNRASELPDGACRLFYGGLCDINKLIPMLAQR